MFKKPAFLIRIADSIKRIINSDTSVPVRIAPSVKPVPVASGEIAFKRVTRLPMNLKMFWCPNGFYLQRHGYAPMSGPCPNRKAAQRTALRNMGAA